jgi:hypothetical protein
MGSMPKMPKIPKIREEERTPLVTTLLEIIYVFIEMFHAFKDEIARLKGEKPRPRIKPSALEKNLDSISDEGDKEKSVKRAGSAKRKKTEGLKIHDTVFLKASDVPLGSRFKGYEDFAVQGLLFQLHNTLYRRERWQTPDGKTIVAPLPDDVKYIGGHFNAALHCFAISQHYLCHVTQPLILEQLRQLGVDISSGQVNRIITEGKERFHEEKEEILRVGLKISDYINVDDTKARHKGKNGYCTHIGNEMFAWFGSSNSKSRLNFLEILRAGNKDYVLNSTAFAYMNNHKLPKAQMELLAGCGKSSFEDRAEWKAILESLRFTKERHIRIATEGALLGSIVEHGTLNPDLVILSDDAGQFAILLHALCWIHSDRGLNKLIGFNDAQRKAVDDARTRLWEFYQDLKAYKQAPSPEKKTELKERFDQIFTTHTCYATLNQVLTRIHKNKSELLLVLDRPEIPLHNNASETDIREYAKKRAISGSTRSDLGRRSRDTFPSLKKTCRKLGIGFWEYLNDRISGKNLIPRLAELMAQRKRE